MKQFLTDLFSLSEHRASVTILAFIAVLSTGLYKTMRIGDFPPNLLELSILLGGYVCGYNIVNKFTKVNEIPVSMDQNKEKNQ